MSTFATHFSRVLGPYWCIYLPLLGPIVLFNDWLNFKAGCPCDCERVSGREGQGATNSKGKNNIKVDSEGKKVGGTLSVSQYIHITDNNTLHMRGSLQTLVTLIQFLVFEKFLGSA